MQSPLMNLPAELRAEILQLLLWTPNALYMANTDDRWVAENDTTYPHQRRGVQQPLYPQILRCSRQLYLEGTPILYDNPIEVRSWFDADGHNNLHVLGRPVIKFRPSTNIKALDAISTSLRTRLRKLHIIMVVEKTNFAMLAVMRLNLRILVNVLRETPAWNELVISFKPNEIEIFRQPKATIHDCDDVLTPLTYLRNFKHVEILPGLVSSSLAHKVADLIMSDKPVVDLHAIYDVLEAFARSVINVALDYTLEWDVADLLHGCAAAADDHDVQRFLKLRKKILELIDGIGDHPAETKLSRSQIFQHDPPGGFDEELMLQRESVLGQTFR